MTSLLRSKSYIGSILAPLLALLLFDYLWGCTHLFHFRHLFVTYTFALFYGVVLAMPVLVWNARRVQAVVVTLLCIWLEAQLLYGRQFFTAIPTSAYGEIFTVVNGLESSVLGLLSWRDLLLLVPILMAWGGCYGTMPSFPAKRQRLVYCALLAGSWAGSWGTVIYDGGIEKSMEFYSYNLTSQRVATYTPFTMLWYDVKLKFTPLDDAAKQQISNWWTDHEKLFGDSHLTVENAPDKVVLIMVESLESWLIGLEVAGQPVMPTLSRLASDSTSLYIPNVVCQVLAGHSSDSQLLVLGGMLPMSSGAWAIEKPQSLKSALPLAFTEAHPDASTAYFAAVNGRNWNQAAYAKIMGFKTGFFRPDYPSGIKARMPGDRLDDVTMSQFVGHFLNTDKAFGVDKEFFVQQVTISLHSDFELPEGVKPELLLKDNYDRTMLGYLQCARFTDTGIKVLLDSLSKRSDFNDITIIITGDHTGILHRRNEIRARHPWVTTAPTVPMVVVHSPLRGKVDKYIGQVDLYPTLLDIMGLDRYRWRGMGISIFNPRHPGVGYSLMEGQFGDPSVPDSVLKHLKEGYTVAQNTLYYDLMQ